MFSPTSVIRGNGVVEQVTVNDRGQLTTLSAGSLLTLGLYPCAGNATACTNGNNGTLRSQTIAIGSPALSLTQTYTYNNLNQLIGATETGGWSQTYAYTDGSGRNTGNRYLTSNNPDGLAALTSETPTGASWYLANNRLNLWSYDQPANVAGVGSMARSFTYDAEDRQATATINSNATTYVYDGEGQRVQKSVSGTITTYVYDAFGNLAAEYSTQPVVSACGTPTCYVTVDHLGSTRKVNVKVQLGSDPKSAPSIMSMTPNESGGFTGYTLYPQPYGPTSNPWSSDSYTHVLVNADRGWIPSTIYHELRHVQAGDFGRVAPYGVHDKGGRVDQSTVEAEKEAVKNQLDVIRR